MIHTSLFAASHFVLLARVCLLEPDIELEKEAVVLYWIFLFL